VAAQTPHNADSPFDLLTPDEAARELNRSGGLSARTLERWRARGDGPPFVRLGRRRVFYRRADLVAWVEQSRQQPGAA
jgi:hypothetical protein